MRPPALFVRRRRSMNSESKELFSRLLLTASPSGSEQGIQHVIAEFAEQFADSIEPDVHGNLIVGVNPNGRRKIMLSAHADQLGFVIKFISRDGYLYVDPTKGVDEGVLQGS